MVKFLTKFSSLIIFMSLILIIYINHYIFVSKKIKIDVIPDLSDKQIIIYCKFEGQSPKVIQDQLTYPLSTALLGLPGVKYVRTYTMANYSLIYVILKENTDLYWARSRVLEKIPQVELPEEAKVELGPDATGVGWAFQYVLTSNELNLAELRDLNDFYIKYRLLSVDGVSEVASIGGFQKEYRITIDPLELAKYKIEPLQIAEIIKNNNIEGSGKYIDISSLTTIIQTKGYFKSLKDIALIPINENLKLKDIASINIVPSLRMGTTDYNGQGNTVGGIVIIRQNADTYQTIQKIKQEIQRFNLPKSVNLIPVYDRSFIIEESIKGLIKDISKELLITIIVVIVFILDFKLSIIICYLIILGVLLTIFVFNSIGITSNIMSLGGLILSVGAMIDAGIVINENYHRKLEGYQKIMNSNLKIYSNFLTNRFIDLQKIKKIFLENTLREVGFPIFVALLIVALSFVPFLYLSGQVGKLFYPLVITKTIAMLIGSILSILLVIPFLHLFGIWKVIPELKNPINYLLEKTYSIIFYPLIIFRFLLIILPIIGGYYFFNLLFSLKTEFLPYLREFSLMYMPTTITGITIDEAQRLLTYQDKVIMTVPEVYSVFGKAGRADTATDPAPLSMIETIITLKPLHMWRKNLTYEKLIEELDKKLQIPGVVNGWTQPIKGRIDMITTGIRTPLGIKIMGTDLNTIYKESLKIEEKLKNSNIFNTVFAERTNIQPYITIEYDRNQLQLRNLNISDVQQYIDYLFNNKPISTFIDNVKRYPISLGVYNSRKYNIESFPIYVKNQFFKLSDVARIKYEYSFSEIKTENGLFVNYIYLVPKANQDINNILKETDNIIKTNLPSGISYEYSGEFKYWQETINNLSIIVPLVLFIIVSLLFIIFGNFKDVFIVLYLLPCAMLGSVLFLHFFKESLSVASIAGIISTMGIAVEMLVIMMVYIKNSLNTTKDLYTDIFNGAVKRVRPKVMTAVTIFISLIPIVYSTEIGSEILKAIVIPMIGGTITSFLTALIIIPPFYYFLLTVFSKKRKKITGI